MGIIETVIVLCLFIYNGDEKKIEGWYTQENIGECLTAKRLASRNSGNQVLYTCSVEECVMKIDSTGAKHCDKIIY